MTSHLLGVAQLARRLSGQDDADLTALLRARPDLVHPAPGDFTGLAVRAQSEMSLRRCLQHLDAGQLRVLRHLADGGFPDDDALAGDALSDVEALGLAFSDHQHDQREAEAPIAVPASLPTVLSSLEVNSSHLPPSDPEPTGRSGPSGPSVPSVPEALVRNASLAAIGELLGEVADLLTALHGTPAATLRTGGVGMRELRRLTSARSGLDRPRDVDVGETVWLLELAAAAALVELDVDADHWRPTSLAERWRRATRHHQHQLLVSGWLLAPRSPLLLRGPHSTARLAPALTADRQRGDAPALRRRVLQTAAALSAGASGAALYSTDLPDDAEPGAAALTGTMIDRMTWERPMLLARVRHVLAPMVREAERLGLLAAGALTEVGAPLAGPAADAAGDQGDPARSPALRLAAMAEYLQGALPAPVDRIHLQSDLTAVAVGVLEPEVAAGLEATAQKETRGGVPTFRFTAGSIRSAFSSGWTAEEVRAFLAGHALGEVPSALSTLIDDAERTWDGVTIGPASSWLIEAEPARRQALLEHPRLQRLGLRSLSPEVLICDADPSELERALDDVGVAVRRQDPEHHRDRARHRDGADHSRRPRTPATPAGAGDGAGEAADGRDAGNAWMLATSPWQQSEVRSLSSQRAEPELVARTVSALRTGHSTLSGTTDEPGDVEGTEVMALLLWAVRSRQPVQLRRVDSEGREHTHRGQPTALNAGRVRLRQIDGDGEAVLLVHRIIDVRLLHEADQTADLGSDQDVAPAEPASRAPASGTPSTEGEPR